MKPTPTLLKLAALFTAILLMAAACGSDDESVSSLGDQPSTQPSGAAPGSEPANAEPPDNPVRTPVGGQVIASANVGGEVVNPQPTSIDDVAILESYPEQIMITFTAGDPACTAANARAVATATQVIVGLDVGITTDALARSCQAGQFSQSITIALEEGLDGRDLVLAEVSSPGSESEITEPEPQPFASKLVGLSEQSAEQAVANEGLLWRIVARDGEFFAVTDDYVQDRINVNIVDGVVVEATVG